MENNTEKKNEWHTHLSMAFLTVAILTSVTSLVINYYTLKKLKNGN